MVYTKTEKPEKMPIGDGYIPDVSEAELEEMVAAIPNCKEIYMELLILTAILKRKRCDSINRMAKDMGRPYATVYDWLLRVHGLGLDGKVDRVAPSRKRILDRDACRVSWRKTCPHLRISTRLNTRRILDVSLDRSLLRNHS